jgi:hypothetical protein
MDTKLLKSTSAVVDSRTSSAAAVIGLLLLFLALYLIATPITTGDTPVYVNDMLRYARGDASAPPWVLWEFGHVLWRPLGYFLWKFAHPLLQSWSGNNPVIEITAVLFAVNFVGGIAMTILAFAVSRKLGLELWPAVIVTTGMLFTSAVINWVHSGSAYIPGLSLNLAALWLILEAARVPGRRQIYSLLAGAALALAFCLWFPYVLGVPAALLLAFLTPSLASNSTVTYRDRWRVVALVTAGTAAVGIVTFVIGAGMCHLLSLSGFRSWVANSSHGILEQRAFLRFPTGVTRAFINLGDEGVTIKRFVFHDPYAPTRPIDLLGAGLWKVLLVFVTFGVLCWALIRTRRGQLALAVVLAGVLPTLLFAIFLFKETSGPERYFPFFVAVFAGICEVVRQKTPGRRAAHFVLGVFLLAMIVVNLKMYGWDLHASAKSSSARFKLVHAQSGHGSVALILSFRDPLSAYFQRAPFDPENRENALPLYHVIDPAFKGVGEWKSASSCRIMQAWNAGGQAWLSKRLVAPRPEPDWEWVEGDVDVVHWSDLPAFFKQLDTNEDLGGPDGFLRIAYDSKNQEIIQGACRSFR